MYLSTKGNGWFCLQIQKILKRGFIITVSVTIILKLAYVLAKIDNNPNFYAYTHDSNIWIDPFGLDIFSVIDWTAPDPSKGGTGYTYKIFQQDVNWDLIDSKGRTNLDWALGGLAPIGADGKSINLHHSKQQANGPLFELSATSHQQYGHTNALHPYRVTPNPDGTKFNPYDPVDRKVFDVDRKQYWKDRANAEIETRKLKIGCK